QLREIDARLRYLSKRLDVLNVVDRSPPDQSRVFFGAWVGLEDDAATMHEYRLVGPDEFDAETEYISIDSPMALALLKKRIDDEIVVAGTTYRIATIRYATDSAG
ncbi:MAG: GreA/GreB family elongation factor, partial [Gammaproteobacteria bacterium]|nr:GreA/GreB family elongation factor [Gammaproteobacteria bacterium]